MKYYFASRVVSIFCQNVFTRKKNYNQPKKILSHSTILYIFSVVYILFVFFFIYFSIVFFSYACANSKIIAQYTIKNQKKIKLIVITIRILMTKAVIIMMDIRTIMIMQSKYIPKTKFAFPFIFFVFNA